MEEIVTGEAVVLDLPAARFPTRMLARLIDLVVQLVTLLIVAFLIGLAGADGTLNDAALAAIALTSYVVVVVGYPTIAETLSRGRTLGKLALGLRVVADDGGPVRFRQALVRALAGVIECWALIGIPALITSMLSARGKRLGDIFAGTFVIRERAAGTPALSFPAIPYPAAGYAGGPSPAAYPGALSPGGTHGPGAARAPVSSVEPALRPWAAKLDLSGLPEPLAASVASYLSRYWQLEPTARDRLGWQLATDVTARVSPPPPPGLTPVAYLYAVLAERRTREVARWQAVPQAGGAQAGGPQAGASQVGGPFAGPGHRPVADPVPAQSLGSSWPGSTWPGSTPPGDGGLAPPA